MQHATETCLDQADVSPLPPLRRLWLDLLAVCAVHVRIAFDRPWDCPRKGSVDRSGL